MPTVCFGSRQATSLNPKDRVPALEFSELVITKPIKKYIVRYVRKPEPIILEALTDGLEIEGETEAKPCKLHEKLHQTILAEAVRMAKAVWSHPNN